MTPLTFEAFTKKIYIKAPVKTLYWCWATEEGITSWFLREAHYVSIEGTNRNATDPIQNGDRYTWKWHNWNGQESGSILQTNGKDFLEFSFANDVCTCSVTLEEVENTTLVTLRQYGMPTDEKTKMELYNGCSCGWTFWLANLKAYLEHGILLNEKDVDLTEIPQAGHIFVNM